MRAWILALVLAFVAGLGIGTRIRQPKVEPTKELAEIRLNSGAVVLHQNPKEPAPNIGPLPHGFKVRHVAKVTIAPPESAIVAQSGAIPVQSLTVAQVDTPQGSRIVVKDDAGRTVGGAAWDMGPPAPEYHWSVQVLRNYNRQTGRLSWGAELTHYRGSMVVSISATGQGVQAGLGFRF